MLCSSAHFACSSLMEAFLHEEEMCKVALACQFFVGRVAPLSGMSGNWFLEFFCLCSIRSLLQCMFFVVLPSWMGCDTKEWDGRATSCE